MEPTDCLSLTQSPSWIRKGFGNPLNTAAPGSTELAAIFRSAQFRVKLAGYCTVERLGILMQAKEQTNKEGIPTSETCAPLGCCPAIAEFEYSFP